MKEKEELDIKSRKKIIKEIIGWVFGIIAIIFGIILNIKYPLGRGHIFLFTNHWVFEIQWEPIILLGIGLLCFILFCILANKSDKKEVNEID